ncbi:hypothetical protein BDW62DRAFT_2589 [Aspergillus aurantiobrunneus]
MTLQRSAHSSLDTDLIEKAGCSTSDGAQSLPADSGQDLAAAKRTNFEEPNTISNAKRIKSLHDGLAEPNTSITAAPRRIPFQDKNETARSSSGLSTMTAPERARSF